MKRAAAALVLVLLSSCSVLSLFRQRPPEHPPVRLPEELIVQDLVVPERGRRAMHGDLVTVHYEGRLADGTIFDSSYDRGEPVRFTLGAGQVTPGLDLGLVGLTVHGQRSLVVPADLAYGAEGLPNVVPPDAQLHFLIELLELE